MSPAKRETPKQKLTKTQQQAQALRLRLMENLTYQQIAERMGMKQATQAQRLVQAAEEQLLIDQANRDFDTWRAKQIHRLETLMGEAWAGWLRSVGNKSYSITDTDTVTKPGEAKGEKAKKEQKKKAKVKRWADAGDPRFIAEFRETWRDLCELMGVRGGGGGGNVKVDPFGTPAAAAATKVIIEQNVYIPGLGHLTPELLGQMMVDLATKEAPEEDE